MASVSHRPDRADRKSAATVAAVVETPQGGRNKYKLDEASGRMKLSKIMPEGMVFPFDFGYIPDTKGPDGDPLDVLILHDEPTFPGCQIDCRLLGVLKARDFQSGREAANHRLIAAATASLEFAAAHELSDLEPTLLRQLEEFFVNYKKAREVRFEITGRGDSRAAYDLLASSGGS
ncbi:MAG TPA: inorganic diphosphatase [Terracidiphilus sp.]|nr:inorganic diphosphatase [Terracidiphilus sp.]